MSKKKSTAKANFEKTPRAEALPNAEALNKKLSEFCHTVTVAGSIRQGKDMVGDIDVVVIPKIDPADFLEKCKSIVEYEYGGQKKIFGMFMGRPINIFVTSEESYGACMYQMTGPMQYNLRMRMCAKRKGFKLNEYSLYNRESGAYVAGRTEGDIFTAMGLTYRTPEQRRQQVA